MREPPRYRRRLLRDQLLRQVIVKIRYVHLLLPMPALCGAAAPAPPPPQLLPACSSRAASSNSPATGTTRAKLTTARENGLGIEKLVPRSSASTPIRDAHKTRRPIPRSSSLPAAPPRLRLVNRPSRPVRRERHIRSRAKLLLVPPAEPRCLPANSTPAPPINPSLSTVRAISSPS